MLLKRMFYFFHVRGDEGGLLALEMTFLPSQREPEAPDAPARLEALGRDFSLLERLVDKLLDENHVTELKKIPEVMDSSNERSIGFEYEGQIKQEGITSISAHLSYKLQKEAGRLYKNPELYLKTRLGHTLNLDLLRETLAFSDMDLSEPATEQLRALYGTLAQYKEADAPKFLFLKGG